MSSGENLTDLSLKNSCWEFEIQISISNLFFFKTFMLHQIIEIWTFTRKWPNFDLYSNTLLTLTKIIRHIDIGTIFKWNYTQILLKRRWHPKVHYDLSCAIRTPKVHYNPSCALRTPKVHYNSSCALRTPKVHYNPFSELLSSKWLVTRLNINLTLHQNFQNLITQSKTHKNV